MQLVVYTSSESFKTSLGNALQQAPLFRDTLSAPTSDASHIHLLHISSLGKACNAWLNDYAASHIAAVCSDKPLLTEMLDAVQAGAKGYCNSYMRDTGYQQMMRLLANGQSWFPPQMLQQTFSLAQQAMTGVSSAKTEDVELSGLTSREKDIALAVSDGKSNKQIADQFEISERTVKTHLTNIFKKLQIKDRIALVLYLKQA